MPDYERECFVIFFCRFLFSAVSVLFFCQKRTLMRVDEIYNVQGNGTRLMEFKGGLPIAQNYKGQ
jgi:hypothetical protein